MNGGRLTRWDRWSMALRAALLQATWNYERQQGLGWAWALKPALDRFYPDAERRRARLTEHTAYFNTQPTLASLALGAVAGLEEQRAAGAPVDAAAVARVKSALGSSLAALGDRLFWLTLRPVAACVGLVFALNGRWFGALAMWACYNWIHLGLRVAGVEWGYREGPEVLGTPLRARLEELVRGLGALGAALIGLIVATVLVPGGEPRPMVFQVLLAAGLVLGMLTAQRARPSPTEWALGIGALCIVAGWIR
jgi:PTS system mannose-specific IID component